MINTPLFESLERQLKLKQVEEQLLGLCCSLDDEDFKEVRYRVRSAIGREQTFLACNIEQWLKENQ